jgi:hypothetical protein
MGVSPDGRFAPFTGRFRANWLEARTVFNWPVRAVARPTIDAIERTDNCAQATAASTNARSRLRSHLGGFFFIANTELASLKLVEHSANADRITGKRTDSATHPASHADEITNRRAPALLSQH